MINQKDIIEKLREVDNTTTECLLQEYKNVSDLYKFILHYHIDSLKDYPRQEEMTGIVLKMQVIVKEALVLNIN